MLIVITKCLSKAADMNIHRAFFDIDIATPDLIKKLGSSIYPFLVSHEELEQSVLGGAHGECTVLSGNTMPDGVQGQAFHFYGAVHARRCCAPKNCFQAGNQ